jgi:Pilus formation protein N terminal region
MEWPSMLRTGLWTTFLLTAMAGASTVWAAENIEVSLGGAELIQLPQSAHQVVIGNPAIADVSMQSARSLSVFGKYPGGTTLAVMDGSGAVILDAIIVVTAGSSEAVTVRYGTGKSWVPGGITSVVECSRERCAPAMALPTDTPYKAGAPPAAPAPAAAK